MIVSLIYFTNWTC